MREAKRWAWSALACMLGLVCMALATGAGAEVVDEVGAAGEAAGAAQSHKRAQIEVIRVTAEKRESAIQETPIAISAFDQAQLDQAGISDVEGLSFNIPNFHYGEVLGAASITIRGVATQGGDQATAFHLDGIYQNNPYVASGLAFYDLERVEVLRGPQGTLYGRNATGGSINVVSRKPSYEFDTFGDVQLGSYHQIFSRGVLDIPLVEDSVALRLSAYQDRRYGYLENLASGTRSGDLDDARSWGMRSQLRLNPTEQIDWTIRSIFTSNQGNGLGSKITGGLPAGVAYPVIGPQPIYADASPNPSDPRKIWLDTPGSFSGGLLIFNTGFLWSFDDSRLLQAPELELLGSWQKQSQNAVADADLTDAKARFPELPADSPRQPAQALPLLSAFVDGEDQEWVAEANFSAEVAEPWDMLAIDWLVGAFYLGTDRYLDITVDSHLPLRLTPNPASPRAVTNNTLLLLLSARDTSAAGFANVTFELWDQLSVSGGIRYSHDWKEGVRHSNQIDFVIPGLPVIGCVVPGVDSERSDDWGAFTGRLGVDWQYREDNMVYASFSNGYKAGTIEHPVPLRTGGGCGTAPVPNTRPEDILAWEIGSKNRFFDQRLQANLTGFAYVYENIQVTTLVQSSFVTQNADAARVLGVELELVAMPVNQLLISASLSYLDARYTDFPNACLVEDPSTCNNYMRDFTGNRLPRSPRFGVSLLASYDLDLRRYGTLTPSVQFYWSDKLYFRASNFDDDQPNGDALTTQPLKSDLQPAYQRTNLRLRWQSADGRFSLEGFVDNVTDTDVVSTKLISSPLVGAPLVSSYNPPRTWGTRLGLQW